MIEAHIKQNPDAVSGMAYCGKCGKRLWEIRYYAGDAELRMGVAGGYRYDIDSRTWTPTETNQRRYRASHDRMSNGKARAKDAVRVRSEALEFHGQSIEKLQVYPAEPDDALLLPVRVVCIRCMEVNVIALPDGA